MNKKHCNFENHMIYARLLRRLGVKNQPIHGLIDYEKNYEPY